MTTTVGSIEGNVSLNIKDFLAKIELVKQEARKLGSEHPTIDVDANTGKAQAAMAAVEAAAQAMGQSAATAGERVKKSASDVSAAQARVAAANQAADVAYERARIAQMRLSEAQESGRSKASSLAAAELALSEAMGRLDKANARATASEVALEQAQQEAANAALKQAAAEEVAAKANDRVADSAGRANARTQLIIAAVVGLTAVAAPLTGALVGVAGGLAGLGAVGVLGIIGAVQAIKQGTQAGQEWSAGLKTLKADMSALAGTAASGLLSSFQRAVALINRDMPQLNSEVAGFARILGSAAVSALQGAITAMHVLNPLFMQGAGVVRSMADGFSSWASNGGLQKFADYAQSVLPQVITTVGDLSAAILHIAEASAPLGTAVLGALDGLANAINAIPTPALTVLAGAALTAYTTFMLFKGATAVINGVTTAAEALGTTIGGLALRAGAVGLAIGALAAVFTAVAQANAEAKARAEAYAGTLNKVTGAITDSTRALVVDNLAKAGAFDAAQKLGVGSKLLTDAVLGNKTALTSVRGAVDAHKDSLGQLRGAHTETGDAARLLAGVLNLEGEGLSEAAKLARQKADAMGDSAAADQGAALSAQGAADAFLAQASAADEAIQKLKGLVDASNMMNNLGQSAEETNARWQASLASIGDEVQRQQDEYQRLNGTLDGFSLSLDANTAAGSANRSMLSGKAADARDAAEAQLILDRQTMDGTAAADKYSATLAAQRQALIDSAVAHGYNAQEVQGLIDKVMSMPSERVTKILADTSPAQNAIQALIQQNYVAWVQVRATLPDLNGSVSGSGRPGLAYGGTIPGMAMGGTAGLVGSVHAVAAAYGVTGGTIRGNGSAWSDTAGLYRLANGEEVISNTVGQAGRWRSMLKAMNRNAPAGEIAGKAMQIAGYVPARVSAPVDLSPVADALGKLLADRQAPSLKGMTITGRLEIGGDGLARIIDGRIVAAESSQQRSSTVNARKAVL